jgi:hypothetical protein
MKIIEWLDGKKMYIGGTSAILIGLGKLGYDWYNGTIAADPWTVYGNWFVIGWSIIAGKSAIKKLGE